MGLGMIAGVPTLICPFIQPVSTGISHVPDTLVGARVAVDIDGTPAFFHLFVQPDLTRLLPATGCAPGG